jgi:hypothetical protein
LRIGRGIKVFHDKQKLKQYLTNTTEDSTRNSAHNESKQTTKGHEILNSRRKDK